MAEEFIVHTDFLGDSFQPILTEVKALVGNEATLVNLLQTADKEAKAYFKSHIEKPKKATAKTE
jgi:CRISPR-associated protein Csc2